MSETFGEEIIHIIPLGHEIDRAIKLFEKNTANKAYILATMDTFGKYSEKMVKKQIYYVKRVREELQAKGIKSEVRSIDMFEPSEIIRHISTIITQEKSKNNNVFINISSSGRLTAALATLVAMAHKVKAYYITADGYSDNPEDRKKHGISICNELYPKAIKNLPVELPPQPQLEVLIKLCKEGKPMYVDDVIKHLGEKKIWGFEDSLEVFNRRIRRKDKEYDDKINFKMRLHKGILEKLESKGYIERKKVGRNNLVKITEKGRFVAYFGGEL